MAARKNVPAAQVRAWFAEAAPKGVPAPGKRGRLHPETVEAFHKANPRLRYDVASEAEKPTITVPVVTLDKSGRKRTVKRTITTEEARNALGHPKGRRGRFSHDILSDVLSQREADKFASSFK